MASPAPAPKIHSLDAAWGGFMKHLLGTHTQLVPRNRILVQATRRIVKVR